VETFGLDTIFKALDVSLDRRKAGFAIGGLFITVLVAGLFTYISVEAESEYISVVSGLVAAASGWILLTLVVGTLAKMSYDELSGRPASGWGAPLAHSRRHLGTLLFSPLALILIISLVEVAQVVLLFAGRIPYLGELWVAVIFLPLLLVNLFLALLLYLGILLIPPVVAAERRGVLETLRRVQQLVRRAPGRILVYLSIAVVLSLLAALVIFPLTYSALTTTRGIAAAALGEDRMTEFQRAIPLVFGSPASSSFYGVPFLSGGSRAVPFTMKPARLILTVSLLSVPVVIFAELFAIFPTAVASAIYLGVMGEAVASEAIRPERSPSPGPAFCINCGAELPAGTKFCVQCGASQEATPAGG
jgi:hypothetical protein